MGLALEQPTKKGVSLVDDDAYELRYEYTQSTSDNEEGSQSPRDPGPSSRR